MHFAANPEGNTPTLDPEEHLDAETGIAPVRKVLAVDDSKLILNLHAVALRQAGVEEVHTAEDGEAALAELEAHGDIEVVILDLMMPGVNGFEFLRRLRARSGPEASTPVLAASTYISERTVGKALSLGANGYVNKPIEPRELRRALRRLFPFRGAA